MSEMLAQGSERNRRHTAGLDDGMGLEMDGRRWSLSEYRSESGRTVVSP